VTRSKTWVAPYKVTTLAVPRDARTALDELAAAEGTTVSALMRGAAVAAYGDRDPRIAAMADARGTAHVLEQLKEH